MKPAKKKLVKKSIKSKSPGVTPLKKKATHKKSIGAVAKSKPVLANVKLSKNGTLQKIKNENLRLTKQLKLKNRELEIEAALESVRARTMAMHKSDELREVVAVMYQRMEPFGFAAGGCELILCNEQTNQMEYWHTNPVQAVHPERYCVPKSIDPFFEQQWNAWKKGIPRLIIKIEGKEKRKLDILLLEQTDFKKIPEETKQWILGESVAVFSLITFKYGLLEAADFVPLSEDKLLILQRFANVFEQTYTRFLDLQKAEAQAREAQIEAALERVRSRSLGMHHSSELKEVVAVLYGQLHALGFAAWGCLIMIFNKEANRIENWVAESTNSDLNCYYVEGQNHPVYKKLWKNWNEQGPSFILHHEDKVKREFDEYWLYETGFKALPEEVKSTVLSTREVYLTYATMRHGFLGAAGYQRLPDDKVTILERFAKVFEQTYTRFLDLQRAEAQAREALIEAALEKVRGSAMAMHNSNDISATTSIVFTELRRLGIQSIRCGVGLLSKDSLMAEAYAATTSSDSEFHTLMLTIDMTEHSSLAQQYETWLRQENYQTILSGEDLRLYYELPFFHSSAFYVPPEHYDQKEYGYYFPFTEGLFYAWTENPYSESEVNILNRFKTIIALTFRRYLDLKKAEAQAREAQIQLSLERVRAKAMAMHHSDELSDVLSVLFEQFDVLDITPMYTFLSLIDLETNSFTYRQTGRGGKRVIAQQTINLDAMDVWKEVADRWKAATYDVVETIYVPKESVQKVFEVYAEIYSALPEGAKVYPEDFPDGMYTTIAASRFGHLGYDHFSPSTEEEKTILLRFNTEFVRLYQHFLDLQKAEAQAREAQIEAALERVRSRTMAMQRSEELLDVASILFQQVKALGVPQWNCGFNIWNIGDKEFTYYPGSPDGKILPTPCKIPLTEHPVFMRFDESRKRGDDLLVYEKGGEEQADHYRYMLSLRGVGDLLQSMLDAGFQLPTFQIDHIANFSYGNLIFITYEHFPEMHDVFKRFAKVFEQTYTRFLDLQKAEAQAREAKIEAALEKVRSRTMAMQRSDELADVAVALFQQVKDLGITAWTAGFNIWQADNAAYIDWITGPTGDFLEPYTVDLTSHSAFSVIREAKQRGDDFFVSFLEGEQIVETYALLNSFADKGQFQKILDSGMQFPTRQYNHFVFGAQVSLMFITYEPCPEAWDIYKRFGKVFEQTYTRFLDLQRAEAQARESQIEAALERVRSRTMAMHRSEEIADILGKIFKELTLLDVALNRVLIWIFNPEEKYISWWSSNPEAESNAESYRVDYNDHPVFLAYFEAWQKRQPLLLYTLGGTLKESWEDHLFQNTELSRLPKAVQDGMRSEGKIFTTSAISDYGLMMAGCFEPFPDEINDIVQRFGRVFQQSYTRYVDVQKAEAQAREATIEASLEKVRGKAMAMHNSNDLIATASLVFTELRNLGIKSFRSGVGLLTKENRKIKLYSATSSADGDSLSLVGWAILDDHPVLKDSYDSWIRNEDYFPVLRGEEIKSYYEKVVSNFSVPVAQTVGVEQHGYFLPFSEGLFYGWSEKPYTEAEIKILHRFKAIVDLTFRRYMELQKSEANAVEAIRQASLDRVRAEIASMRTTNDLDRITPLIWKELNILSIPFVRCGVFIMDELQRQIHTFLSAPDGKAIAAFHLPYDSPGNIREILSHWVSKKMYIRHWDQTAFTELGDLLVQQGALPSKEIYMSTIPPEGIHLHCLPFLQGMLYVGNTTKLKEDDIHLIQSVADAFATAYARYEDFNKLESANVKIEKTLVDLKQTQAQLVQSEKMASLGELTAGIAHEIQNPLNFVNNFSEVNKELLTEMDDEIEKGNFTEVRAIVKDVISNEEKISHHGKRADAIVKGMLQHSRSSSGVKEPTDINALADEYLRLAYHGLRAKDKGFNATMKKDYDESLEKIEVIPQDIGRVILNLITNAFYAVTEKKKSGIENYEPTVSVGTKKIENSVLISVKDNGDGIPQKVLDKIFQPFFTTKPTGQGTGLGLSLSYDIVKAHAGELSVETIEGQGSEFTIKLPIV